ncbi:MAG: benzoyl-CoA-dihydrodiol lyase [Planctomycetes bacterium]|nr:benzoyl-CoA-dihydrodiol lyase [Planctomycetota bacterium]
MTDFQTHPDRYRHWRLSFDGPVARLEMAVNPTQTFAPGYELKLNSYDLGVDIELADAVQRIRFEHPEVRVVSVGSALDRVFCAGANIRMLAASSHPFKVNFCKFTNETRLSIEDSSRHSGIRWVAGLNGTTAGGGYELALACDEIYLVDDGNSAVSLPEVPLLGVLPGTGGLTRLVDKRKVRRDHADLFSTLIEGVKARRAQQWNLIDGSWPRSSFAEKVAARARELAQDLPERKAARGIRLAPVAGRAEGNTLAYEYVTLQVEPEKRVATLTVHGPRSKQPRTGAEYEQAGDRAWALQAFRELDDALLQLRFGHETVGVVRVQTRGDADAVLAVEKDLLAQRQHWLVNEIVLHMARVLRRLDLTARSLFAIVDAESCFTGALFEAALACDRIYMLDDAAGKVQVAIGPLANGALPMSHGLTRLQCRFLANPAHAARLALEQPRYDARSADEHGLVSVLADDIDWADTVRMAIEERASLSPDALTGMEASLRFGGPETCDSKIFARLSAWQNWIFTRPNATGDEGALVSYGKPTKARFDWRRT